MYSRIVSIDNNYSFVLLGPRGSGKSTLLRKEFESRCKLWIDLLIPEEEMNFQAHPSELMLRSAHLSPGSWVVIDEIQRVPALLDLAHKLIEERKLLFALTGSSARKLKRGGGNLLAGRAFVTYLFPLSVLELKEFNDTQLLTRLNFGLLPKVGEFNSEEHKIKFLQSYTLTYLKEEIAAEQLVRNLPVFSRFLEVAGQMAGQAINYSAIARDIGSTHTLMQSYFQVLEDTLLGFHLLPYHKSIRKQQRQAAKFYFIDVGVARAVARALHTPLVPQSYEYARRFEQFLIAEIYKLCQYRARDEILSYLCTKDDVEVDLVIDRPGKSTLFIEIKSTSRLQEKHFKGLSAISQGVKGVEPLIISQDLNTKKHGSVHAMHWLDFLNRYWHDKI